MSHEDSGNDYVYVITSELCHSEHFIYLICYVTVRLGKQLFRNNLNSHRLLENVLIVA